MEEINLSLKDLLSPPPMMPWRGFADWIRMSGSHDIVWGGFATAIRLNKVGKHVMVNVALLA
jgi:hypothetical protein